MKDNRGLLKCNSIGVLKGYHNTVQITSISWSAYPSFDSDRCPPHLSHRGRQLALSSSTATTVPATVKHFIYFKQTGQWQNILTRDILIFRSYCFETMGTVLWYLVLLAFHNSKVCQAYPLSRLLLNICKFAIGSKHTLQSLHELIT